MPVIFQFNPMPKFRSIRWRLVAGFTLLTLLTVSLLGALVLGLMQRYIAQQENAYLRENAVAIAQQSAPFFTTTLPPQELRSLARTASLLGNFRVKILDADENTLIDSALPRFRDHLTWVTPAGDLPLPNMPLPNLEEWHEEVVIIDSVKNSLPPDGPMADFVVLEPELSDQQLERFEQLIPGEQMPSERIPSERMPSAYQIRIIRQNQGEWGPRLEFERAPFLAGHLTETGVITTTARDFTALHSQEGDPTADAGTGARLPLLQRVVLPIQVQDGVVGYVELSSRPGVAAEALSALRRLFLLAGAAVSTIAVTAGLAMSRGLTAPLHALTAATQRMNEGDLSTRAAVQSNDEIGLLASAFNRMAAALEKNFADLAAERDALRTFIGDASHELRTPITALRTFNDLLQGSAAQDSTARSEFLSESALQLQRLERITESLLNLSRLDGGLVELRLVTVRVESLVAHTVEMLSPLAAERAITLTIEPIAPSLMVHCDHDQLESALLNLVENALKFTSAHGHVQVGAAPNQDNSGVTIWVRDDGVGITPTEQKQIFQRFYRGPNATNGGSGLGLAIVHSVVSAHGGTVTVESEEGQGALFQLHLPMSTDKE